VTSAPITYGSVCSGIEAPGSAWHPLGWKPLWFSEIEAFPKAVLAHHYPTVPDLGDMTTLPARILAGEVPAPDVFVGGTPCQSFSVAGLRKGLADPRGQLTRTFVEIIDALDTVRLAAGKPPVLALWENVPGVLSDKDNAFGNFLGALAGEDDALLPPGGRWSNGGCVLGPQRTVAWRVLDAQYFGVAQRRRRVFAVISARSSAVDPVEVLLVEQGMRRDTPPSREAGQGTPAPAARSASQQYPELPQVVGTLSDGAHNGGGSTGRTPTRAASSPSAHYPELPEVAWCLQHRDAKGADSDTKPGHVIPVRADGGSFDPVLAMAVRRLTPEECERLQGFPDNHTRIPWKGKPASDCPDGPRYRALGNSMAVPVIRWIGRKIEERMEEAYKGGSAC